MTWEIVLIYAIKIMDNLFVKKINVWYFIVNNAPTLNKNFIWSWNFHEINITRLSLFLEICMSSNNQWRLKILQINVMRCIKIWNNCFGPKQNNTILHQKISKHESGKLLKCVIINLLNLHSKLTENVNNFSQLKPTFYVFVYK